MNIRNEFIRRVRRGKGFSLIELMVGVSISTLVMAGAVSLQYLSARSAKTIYGEARTRGSRMSALDQIRYRLANAKIGSCVVSEIGYRIEFQDPNLGAGLTSAFYFTPSLNTLYYDKDIADGTAAAAVARGPIDVRFQIQSSGQIIRLKVKSASDTVHGDVDIQDGETKVYLRNS